MRTAPIKAATTPPPVNGKVRQLRGNLRHTMTKDFKRSNRAPGDVRATRGSRAEVIEVCRHAEMSLPRAGDRGRLGFAGLSRPQLIPVRWR